MKSLLFFGAYDPDTNMASSHERLKRRLNHQNQSWEYVNKSWGEAYNRLKKDDVKDFIYCKNPLAKADEKKHRKVMVAIGGNCRSADLSFSSFKYAAMTANADLVILDYLKRVERLKTSNVFFGSSHHIEDAIEYSGEVLADIMQDEEFGGKEHSPDNTLVVMESAGGFVGLGAVEYVKKTLGCQYPHVYVKNGLGEPAYYLPFETLSWLIKKIYNACSYVTTHLFRYDPHDVQGRWLNAGEIYSKIPSDRKAIVSINNDDVIATYARIHRNKKKDKTVHLLNLRDKNHSARHNENNSNLISMNDISAEQIFAEFCVNFRAGKPFNHRGIQSKKDRSFMLHFLKFFQLLFAAGLAPIYIPLYTIRKWRELSNIQRIGFTLLSLALIAGVVLFCLFSHVILSALTVGFLTSAMIYGATFAASFVFNFLKEIFIRPSRNVENHPENALSNDQKIIFYDVYRYAYGCKIRKTQLYYAKRQYLLTKFRYKLYKEMIKYCNEKDTENLSYDVIEKIKEETIKESRFPCEVLSVVHFKKMKTVKEIINASKEMSQRGCNKVLEDIEKIKNLILNDANINENADNEQNKTTDLLALSYIKDLNDVYIKLNSVYNQESLASSTYKRDFGKIIESNEANNEHKIYANKNKSLCYQKNQEHSLVKQIRMFGSEYFINMGKMGYAVQRYNYEYATSNNDKNLIDDITKDIQLSNSQKSKLKLLSENKFPLNEEDKTTLDECNEFINTCKYLIINHSSNNDDKLIVETLNDMKNLYETKFIPLINKNTAIPIVNPNTNIVECSI